MLTTLQTRTLQLLANEAVADMSSRLGSHLGLDLRVPKVEVHEVDAADVIMALDSGGGVRVMACQAFFGDRVSGEALLLPGEQGLERLGAMLGSESSTGWEPLLHMAALLLGCCVKTVLDRLDIGVLFKHPHLLDPAAQAPQPSGWTRTLALDLDVELDSELPMHLMVLFHPRALPALGVKLGVLAE